MKILLPQVELNEALGVVSKAISSKPTLPILGNILIEATKEKITFSATDLQTSISYILQGQIEEEGVFSVPAKIFTEFISSLPQTATITLEKKETLLQISSFPFESSINGIEGEEFPPLPQPEGKALFKIEAKQLSQAVSEVSFSASADDSRQILTGVLLKKAKEKEIELVATDGFRLSIKNILCENPPEAQIVLPARPFLELAKIAEGKEEGGEKKGKNLNFFQTKEKNQIVVQSEGFKNAFTMSLRLFEGEYPHYEKIIPKNFVARAILELEDIVKATRVAAIFARGNTNVIYLSLSVAEKTCTIYANTKEVGQEKSVLEGSCEGEPLKIAFNSRFLTEALSVFKTSQISLEFSGPLSPAVLKGVGDNSYSHILMPIRTEE